MNRFEVAHLVDLIRKSFSVSPIPQVKIIMRSSGEEPAEIQALIGGLSWPNVDSELLLKYEESGDVSAMPAFLSEVGFRYYLPAFLTYVASKPKVSGLLLDHLLHCAADEYSNCEIIRFNGQERRAVLAFLEHQLAQIDLDEFRRRDVNVAIAAWSK